MDVLNISSKFDNMHTNELFLTQNVKSDSFWRHKMAQTTITARVSKEDKTAFEQFCNEVGLSASSAINLFVKAVLRKGKIPFEISREEEDPFYSPEFQAELLRRAREMESGKAHVIIQES